MSQRSQVTYIVTLLLLCLAGTFAWGATPTSLKLTVSLASPTAVGMRVNLTATPDTPGALEYKFRVKYTDTAGSSVWTTVQEYSTKNTCTWTPPEAHIYTIVAYTRLQGTAIPYLLYRDQVITVKPAITDISVIVSPASPDALRLIQMSVYSVNGGTVEYSFKVKYRSVNNTYIWHTIKEYSLENTCHWTAPKFNSYIFYVYAREKGRNVPYTVFKEIPLTINPPVSALQLTTSIHSPAGVGTPVKLTATATDGGTLEYKFFARYRDFAGVQQIELIKDYSPSNVVTWSPKIVTTYSSVVAQVREKGYTTDYERQIAIYKYVVVPAVSSLALTASPSIPALNQPTTFTATPIGGGTLEYKFRAKYLSAPGVYAWLTLQEYGASNTCTWTPTEAHPYILYVYAREKGNNIPYSVYKEMPFKVNTPPNILQLTTSCPSPTGIGTPVKLTATATYGDMLEYKFYARYKDSVGVLQLELIKDYSPSNVVAWSPKQITTYISVIAVARKIGNTNSFDMRSYISNFVVAPAVTSLALTASPSPITYVSIPTFLTATPTGGGTLEYQFKAKYLSTSGVYVWLTLQEYGASNTCTWTPTVAQSYTIIAYAREKGTTGAYKVYRDMPIIVVAQAIPAGTVIINAKDKAPLVWVPSGTFTMGNADGVGSLNAQPAHQVTLSGYWIYKYEVTVSQYRAFCTATMRKLPQFPYDYSWKGKTGWDDPALQLHPIVNVTWNDAKAYADWAGVILPTEAQWEFAARGPQGNNYPWGGTATAADPYNGWDQTKCSNMNNSYSVGKSSWPVGSFPAGASWCGAQDMMGSIWQWCNDWYSSCYTSVPVTNPTGPGIGTTRVLRGGTGLYDNSNYASNRNYYYPNTFNESIGFRCAFSSPGL
ncbi:MAG: SUMF1/EgtB/PvdO family nonheme iron enzyme [bacterium]